MLHSTYELTAPVELINKHRLIRILIDFFWVQCIPFLHTISDSVNLRSEQSVTRRCLGGTKRGLDIVHNLYINRCFESTTYHGDNVFDSDNLRDHLSPAALGIRGAGQHDEEVE